ncbi:MAG: hypothetical protein CVU09_09045 [Bacteroidetes bacterium HGW-Bacteroidetes-4]|jgi:hypothetical protein|nr:MAG: hypothetical protein CVU09_09045 [Bacteroidetes bacterium HGW-Bacteroidetes-4]
MKRLGCILAFTLLLTGFLQAQKVWDNVQVKILHHEKVYLDTIFQLNPYKASRLIQKLVSRYSTEEVFIDAYRLHSLYVFDINDKYWKGDYLSENSEERYSEVEINLDSMFRSFQKSLEEHWTSKNWEQRGDSLDKQLEQLKENLKTFKQGVEPDLQKFQQSIQEFFETLKTTRIVIIREGDTIRID